MVEGWGPNRKVVKALVDVLGALLRIFAVFVNVGVKKITSWFDHQTEHTENTVARHHAPPGDGDGGDGDRGPGVRQRRHGAGELRGRGAGRGAAGAGLLLQGGGQEDLLVSIRRLETPLSL